jgi:hypothetical protein
VIARPERTIPHRIKQDHADRRGRETSAAGPAVIMTHIVKLFGADCFIPRFDLGLLVQNHVQQGTMDFQSSIVFDKAQLAELVHEKTHA